MTGQEQKILFVHKKIVIPVTTEAETTVTLVAENKVHQAIGVAIHVATDVHTRKETSRDTKITALENPINLITITTDLQIDPRQDYGDQKKIIITHQEHGLPFKIIAHTSKEQAQETTSG